MEGCNEKTEIRQRLQTTTGVTLSENELEVKPARLSADKIVESYAGSFYADPSSGLPFVRGVLGIRAIKVILENKNRKTFFVNNKEEVYHVEADSIEDYVREFSKTICDDSSFRNQLLAFAGSEQNLARLRLTDRLAARVRRTIEIFGPVIPWQRAQHAEIAPIRFFSQSGLCWHKSAYDPLGDTCPPAWSTYARCSNWRALCAWFWVVCTGGPRHQYVWLTGPGGSGKSVLVSALESCFGRSFATTDLDKMESPYFGSEIEGKRLVHIPEARSKFVMSDQFKHMTGDTSIRVERKFETVYNATNISMFIFTSNHPPELSNEPEHMRRIILCELPPFEGDADPDFVEKLKSEFSQFLGYCRACAQELNVKFEIKCDRTIAAELAKDAEDWKESLIERYFIRDPDSRVESRILIAKLRDDIRDEWKAKQLIQWYCKKYNLAATKSNSVSYRLGLRLR
jgi:hypothetical protein